MPGGRGWQVSERPQSVGSVSNGLSGLFCVSRWWLLFAAPFTHGAERSKLRHQSPSALIAADALDLGAESSALTDQLIPHISLSLDV
jgi:hypothetical protein